MLLRGQNREKSRFIIRFPRVAYLTCLRWRVYMCVLLCVCVYMHVYGRIKLLLLLLLFFSWLSLDTIQTALEHFSFRKIRFAWINESQWNRTGTIDSSQHGPPTRPSSYRISIVLAVRYITECPRRFIFTTGTICCLLLLSAVRA